MTPSLAIASLHAVASGHAGQVKTIRDLRIELARAQDRIEELQALLGLDIAPPPLVRIPPYPLKILGLLLAKPRVTTAMIETALYGGLPDADWPRTPQDSIKVHVHHLRRLLAGYGIAISTMREGVGPCSYAMSSAMQAKAREVFGLKRVTS